MAAARQAAEAAERGVNAVPNRLTRKGEAMSEGGNDLLGLTEKIVSAHVANNRMSRADLPDLIRAGNTMTGSAASAVHSGQ